MSVEIMDSISQIAEDEWNVLNMDFASIDGVYQYALVNEKTSSSIKPKYIHLLDEYIDIYCLLNEVELSSTLKSSSNDWFHQFIRSYFGDEILHIINSSHEKYKRIILINFPRLDEVNTLYVIKKLYDYLYKNKLLKDSLLVYNTFHFFDTKELRSFTQNPYMYFDLNGVDSYDNFLRSLSVNKRRNLIRDEKKMIDKNIVIQKIKIKDYLDEILEMNQSSKYPNLEDVIKSLQQLESNNAMTNFGFFRNSEIIQYFSILYNLNSSYLCFTNPSDYLKEWNGILNMYRFYLQDSIDHGVRYAYLAYEAEEAKQGRGALKLFRYCTIMKLEER